MQHRNGILLITVIINGLEDKGTHAPATDSVVKGNQDTLLCVCSLDGILGT